MAYDDPFDRRRTPPAVAPSYLAWLAVIIVGVTVGNLLSTYITARITAYQAEAAMAELQRSMQTQAGQARAAAAEAARRDAERQAAQQAALRDQRTDDPTGRRLWQSCADWRRADADLHSATTQAEVDRHCGRFESYVSTGVPPGR